MPSIHLTTEERSLFDALPPSLTSEWTVEEEKGTAFESPDALKMRAEISPLRRHPLLRAMVDDVRNNKEMDALQLPDLSEEDIAEFLFTIGARGITVFVKALLLRSQNDEDIRLLSTLTGMRHQILEANASVSYM